jgi:hypothetical protein
LLHRNKENIMRNPDHRHYPHGPKILPWLAHKAGISERRAEMLWQAALKHADHVAGQAGQAPSSAYWQMAMDRLRELIAAESQREDAASFGWRPWSRNLAQVWLARLEVLDEIALAPVRAWRILGQHEHTTRTPLIH